MQESDIRALGHYWGAHEFLASLGASLQVYLENVASCFPGLHKLECSPMYTFIEVGCARLQRLLFSFRQ